jgi:hypothetical protein
MGKPICLPVGVAYKIIDLNIPIYEQLHNWLRFTVTQGLPGVLSYTFNGGSFINGADGVTVTFHFPAAMQIYIPSYYGFSEGRSLFDTSENL